MKSSYILFLIVLLQVSCKRDLDLKPTSVITSNSFFKAETDVTGAVYGMYQLLRVEVANANLYFLGEARSEIMTSSLGGTLGYDKYYQQTLSATNPGPNWQGLYAVINSANLVLKYAPDIAFSSAVTKNNMIAQAYTMRAYMYFTLVRSWGDIPLRTEPTEGYDPQTIQVARSPKAEVFALIKADLDKALSLYATNTFTAGRNTWSKPAANALKADVYLWSGKQLGGGNADFTIALAAIADIPTSDVQLLPNFADVFDYNTKGNKEVIMAVRFQLLENVRSTAPVIGPDNLYANMYIQTTNIPASAPQVTKDLIGVGGGQNIWGPTAAVRSQFTSDDLRRNGTFLEIFATTASGPLYFATLNMKGKGVVSGGTRFFVNDVMLYRYADILLMKAEAKNALGQDPTTEVNLVRQRAYGTNYNSHIFVNGTKVQNDDAILQERLLEFLYEGKRWFDLIRFNKVFELVPLLKNRSAETHLLLFPVGSDVLSLEPKITQNTGWQ